MSNHYSSGTNQIMPNRRPATIAELAEAARIDLWDPSKSLKHWLRTAERARKAGRAFHDEGNWEPAFVEYARAATLVVNKLPSHREYSTLLTTEQRHNLGINGEEILQSLGELKPKLLRDYENWVAKHGEPDPSIPTFLSIAKEETAIRKADEQQKEAERARLSSDLVRRDYDPRREGKGRAADDRGAREGSPWSPAPDNVRHKDVAGNVAEVRRPERVRETGEEEMYLLQAERARREEDSRRYDEDEHLRRRVEERRKHEQEGILRRQAEAEAAARAARRDVARAVSPVPPTGPGRPVQDIVRHPAPPQESPRIRSMPVAAPHPSRPMNGHHINYPDPRHMPSVMSLESPARYEYDSSTDIEERSETPWGRAKHQSQPELTPSRLGNGFRWDPPMTTTSPAPPDLKVVSYPSIMSTHQLKQGYVPSLQSMFSSLSMNNPGLDSSLLFESKPPPPNELYSNILPKPSSAVQAASQYRHAVPAPAVDPHPYQYSTQHVGQRGPSPGGARPPPIAPLREVHPPAPVPAPVQAPRIVPSTSKDPAVRELKTVRLPRDCLPKFVSIARVNTLQNKETCGLLLGKDKGNKYVVSTLLIPKQRSTSDTCTMDEEELVLQFTEERHLITLGWIHTHPTQSCFMSSVDLHTHSGFQRMLPESFAVVCAPSSTPMYGIFRLTDPGGLQTILECDAKEAFHPHPPTPIYTDCDNCHVQMKDMPIEIVDLR